MYGINYGRIAYNLPSLKSVVTLLKAAKIKNIRIYDVNHEVLTAFNGSGIEIVVGLGSEFLTEMGVNEDRAMSWIKENVQPLLPGTSICGIVVENEILATKNVYNALDRLDLTKVVQVQSPHSLGVFANLFPPSSCTFKEDIVPYMKPILQFFSQIVSPFFINAYPFLTYMIHYDNVFDAQIDAAYVALEKAGFGKMQVIVSETGWPSRGDESEAGASKKNARTYNNNLCKRLAKKKGTPYGPKIPMKASVFALFNENLKPGGTSERNFGLFKADGSVAYDIGCIGLNPCLAASSLLSVKMITLAASSNEHTVDAYQKSYAMIDLYGDNQQHPSMTGMGSNVGLHSGKATIVGSSKPILNPVVVIGKGRPPYLRKSSTMEKRVLKVKTNK
ncbi:hypothetical protein I3842_02G057600 [Carya illinoinensis]|uniref:glucan endo-1,3-beta-D-glucosidase n=1 Tax=Carya illinoinensis TaxID=32201 RepID=A0A922FNB9_CARIL|nr:hypothetical protein I3842_02G057600 [Carya illinoinensis]